MIDGQIWIDAKDWGIVQIQGSPAKRPSFWARHTQIDRRYKRIDGMWLNDSLESISDVLIAGRSSLTIQYSYESIQTDPQYGSPENAASLITAPSLLLPTPASTIPEEVCWGPGKLMRNCSSMEEVSGRMAKRQRP